jgi:predicted metal-dependent enzyme (double-stranded beta helix superfamily)
VEKTIRFYTLGPPSRLPFPADFVCIKQMSLKSCPKAVSFAKSPDVKDISLLLHGQGVFLFESTDAPCIFSFYDETKTNGLQVKLTETEVFVNRIPDDEPLIDKNNKTGLTTNNGAYYWVSLDSQNQTLQAGIGEPRTETAIYKYQFAFDEKEEAESNKKFLESLVSISIPSVMRLKPLRLLRDPITSVVPLIVKNIHELTMNHIARGTYMPVATMTSMAQRLYKCIAGKNFVLDTDDFPDFSKAIEYSIATPGLWCNTRLLEKSREFNKDKPDPSETYLRITLNENNGESPGIPYVMEIWPVGHYSPIHNHAGASAVIRVLHGKINVSLFPYLCCQKDTIEPFGISQFVKDDITWISPALNQTHQLRNMTTSSETCITIQCYMYEENNEIHYDYFDYIDADGNKQQYEPDSDMDFISFRELMRREWEARPQKTTRVSRFASSIINAIKKFFQIK